MYTVVYGECKHFFKSSQVLEKEKVVAKLKEKANLLSKSKMDPKSMERALLAKYRCFAGLNAYALANA